MAWGPESFIGGHVALDFTNTVGGAHRERVERLVSWADVVAWAQAADVLDDAEAAALSELSEATTAGALEDLRASREALYRWLAGAVDGEPTDETDRERVTADIGAALAAARPAADPMRDPAWRVTLDDAGPALPGRRLALATAALLAGEERRRIGRCGRCSWLFLDPSPSRRRRWCSMATCGNRAKAARHHARSS